LRTPSASPPSNWLKGEAQATICAELAAAREATTGANAMIERIKEAAARREQVIRAEAALSTEAAAREKLEEGERCLKEMLSAFN
jgi:hypothetical protein